MVEIGCTALGGSESVGSAHDDFGLVVHTFHGTVGDASAEVVENVVHVAEHRAGELPQRRETGAHGPGAPELEEALGPARTLVLPEPAEHLLQQVGPVDFRVQPDEGGQPLGLPAGKVPRVLQPQVAAVLHQVLVGLALLPDLLSAHLVDRLSQMAHDVELVEDDERLRRPRPHRVDVGPPHVAADRFQPLRTVLSEEVEEPLKRLPGAPVADPHQPALLQVVDDRQIDMAPLPGDLVHADVRQFGQILAFAAPGHYRLHGLLHRRPRATEHPGHMRPGQELRPLRHRHRHRPGEPLLPLRPGHRLHPQPASLAAHPAKGVDQRDRNTPQRHVPVTPLPPLVPVLCLLPALPATGCVPTVRNDPHNDLVRPAIDSAHSKPLQVQRLLDQRLDPHRHPLRDHLQVQYPL